jgi:hypothetical protein
VNTHITIKDLLRDVMQLIRVRSAEVSSEETATMMWCAAFLDPLNEPVTDHDRGVAMLRLGALLGTKNTNRLRTLNEKRRGDARRLGLGNGLSLPEIKTVLTRWEQDIASTMQTRNMGKRQAMKRLRIPPSTYYKYVSLTRKTK